MCGLEDTEHSMVADRLELAIDVLLTFMHTTLLEPGAVSVWFTCSVSGKLHIHKCAYVYLIGTFVF